MPPPPKLSPFAQGLPPPAASSIHARVRAKPKKAGLKPTVGPPPPADRFTTEDTSTKSAASGKRAVDGLREPERARSKQTVQATSTSALFDVANRLKNGELGFKFDMNVPAQAGGPAPTKPIPIGSSGFSIEPGTTATINLQTDENGVPKDGTLVSFSKPLDGPNLLFFDPFDVQQVYIEDGRIYADLPCFGEFLAAITGTSLDITDELLGDQPKRDKEGNPLFYPEGHELAGHVIREDGIKRDEKGNALCHPAGHPDAGKPIKVPRKPYIRVPRAGDMMQSILWTLSDKRAQADKEEKANTPEEKAREVVAETQRTLDPKSIQARLDGELIPGKLKFGASGSVFLKEGTSIKSHITPDNPQGFRTLENQVFDVTGELSDLSLQDGERTLVAKAGRAKLRVSIKGNLDTADGSVKGYDISKVGVEVNPDGVGPEDGDTYLSEVAVTQPAGQGKSDKLAFKRVELDDKGAGAPHIVLVPDGGDGNPRLEVNLQKITIQQASLTQHTDMDGQAGTFTVSPGRGVDAKNVTLDNRDGRYVLDGQFNDLDATYQSDGKPTEIASNGIGLEIKRAKLQLDSGRLHFWRGAPNDPVFADESGNTLSAGEVEHRNGQAYVAGTDQIAIPIAYVDAAGMPVPIEQVISTAETDADGPATFRHALTGEPVYPPIRGGIDIDAYTYEDPTTGKKYTGQDVERYEEGFRLRTSKAKVRRKESSPMSVDVEGGLTIGAPSTPFFVDAMGMPVPMSMVEGREDGKYYRVGDDEPLVQRMTSPQLYLALENAKTEVDLLKLEADHQNGLKELEGAVLVTADITRLESFFDDTNQDESVRVDGGKATIRVKELRATGDEVHAAVTVRLEFEHEMTFRADVIRNIPGLEGARILAKTKEGSPAVIEFDVDLGPVDGSKVGEPKPHAWSANFYAEMHDQTVGTTFRQLPKEGAKLTDRPPVAVDPAKTEMPVMDVPQIADVPALEKSQFPEMPDGKLAKLLEGAKKDPLQFLANLKNFTNETTFDLSGSKLFSSVAISDSFPYPTLSRQPDTKITVRTNIEDGAISYTKDQPTEVRFDPPLLLDTSAGSWKIPVISLRPLENGEVDIGIVATGEGGAVPWVAGAFADVGWAAGKAWDWVWGTENSGELLEAGIEGGANYLIMQWAAGNAPRDASQFAGWVKDMIGGEKPGEDEDEVTTADPNEPSILSQLPFSSTGRVDLAGEEISFPGIPYIRFGKSDDPSAKAHANIEITNTAENGKATTTMILSDLTVQGLSLKLDHGGQKLDLQDANIRHGTMTVVLTDGQEPVVSWSLPDVEATLKDTTLGASLGGTDVVLKNGNGRIKGSMGQDPKGFHALLRDADIAFETIAARSKGPDGEALVTRWDDAAFKVDAATGRDQGLKIDFEDGKLTIGARGRPLSQADAAALDSAIQIGDGTGKITDALITNTMSKIHPGISFAGRVTLPNGKFFDAQGAVADKIEVVVGRDTTVDIENLRAMAMEARFELPESLGTNESRPQIHIARGSVHARSFSWGPEGTGGELTIRNGEVNGSRADLSKLLGMHMPVTKFQWTGDTRVFFEPGVVEVSGVADPSGRAEFTIVGHAEEIPFYHPSPRVSGTIVGREEGEPATLKARIRKIRLGDRVTADVAQAKAFGRFVGGNVDFGGGKSAEFPSALIYTELNDFKMNGTQQGEWTALIHGDGVVPLPSDGEKPVALVVRDFRGYLTGAFYLPDPKALEGNVPVPTKAPPEGELVADSVAYFRHAFVTSAQNAARDEPLYEPRKVHVKFGNIEDLHSKVQKGLRALLHKLRVTADASRVEG